MAYPYPYQYPQTTFQKVNGPEDFNWLIGLSVNQSVELLFAGTFDLNFHVVFDEKNDIVYPLEGDYDPYRIVVSVRRGLNDMEIEDDIIETIKGLY